jgi:apolipoprotein N-acyltransferase
MKLFVHPAFGVAAALLTGGLLYLSRDIGPDGSWVLLAPVPILAFALSTARVWHIALAASLARLLGAGALVQAYAGVFPPAPLAIFVSMQVVAFTVTVLLTRIVYHRLGIAGALLAWPSLTVSGEYALSLVSPHGSFGALGYAVTDLTALLQLASVGGVPLLSFAAALVPIGAALLAVRPSDWRAVGLIAGLPLATALVFGVVRLNEPYESHVRVGSLSIDAEQGRAFRSMTSAQSTASAYAEALSALTPQRPDVTVLPEKVFAGGQVSVGPLSGAARAVGGTIVAGFDETLADGRHVNSARVIGAGGSEALYIKRRLIPGLESAYTVGDRALIIGSRSVAICKDFDFAAMIREYGAGGAQLMLAPAWDFVRDGRLHARMAVVRGVENGFALARAAAHGRLTLSDRYGRIVAEVVTDPDRPTSLVAEVGLHGGGTLYSRIGDVFAWLALVLACLLLIAAVSRRPSSNA